jgi:S1-C subfamily serine protease
MKRDGMIQAVALAWALTGATGMLPMARAQAPVAQAPAPKGAAAGPLSPKQIDHKLLPSTCWVLNEGPARPQAQLSFGTGWVVDARRRLIVTNDHVVEGVDSVRFSPADPGPSRRGGPTWRSRSNASPS